MSSGRRKLLLADDSPTIQKVISLTFEDEDFEVVAVGDGAQALRVLADEPPPDVVLADVVMPGPDGYELCERIKRDARLKNIPVVLLVGTFEPFNEAEARRVGADTVLTKPFQSIRNLVGKVGSLLGGESKADEPADGERAARRAPRRRGDRARRSRRPTRRARARRRSPRGAGRTRRRPGLFLRGPRRRRRADRGAAGRSLRRAPDLRAQAQRRARNRRARNSRAARPGLPGRAGL